MFSATYGNVTDTNLVQSFFIGTLWTIPGLAYVLFGTTGTTGLFNWIFVAWLALSAVMYPLSRELYFRVRNTLLDGSDGWLLGFPWFLILFVFRLAISGILFFLALPLGIVSGIWLAIRG